MYAIQFNPRGMTRKQYDTVNEGLTEQLGEETPDGWIFHTCYGEEGNLRVFEVWESKEAQEAFAKTLMPLIEAAGIQLDEAPLTYPVQQIVDEDGQVRSGTTSGARAGATA
jgi:hypothetical protein